MALERRSPLPKGFYWVDVIGAGTDDPVSASAARFNAWRTEHGKTVKIRATQPLSEGGEWVMFEVLEPTPWLPATEFGFPNKATGAETQVTDVIDRPEPQKDPIDKLAEAVDVDKLAAGAGEALGIAAAVLALGYVVTRWIRR